MLASWEGPQAHLIMSGYCSPGKYAKIRFVCRQVCNNWLILVLPDEKAAKQLLITLPPSVWCEHGVHGNEI